MKELDLTKGSVPKTLLQFALPFLIANVLQALYAARTCSSSGSMTTRRASQAWPSAAR